MLKKQSLIRIPTTADEVMRMEHRYLTQKEIEVT